ncbi:unnamed protein product [Trichogramma brassicae]|uniref:Fatty acid-binding protein, muscle n=1 Tax=Trichogramma brassicae TaxID=86971 RepID=A0A6H5IHF4_9HYME|nr:unnamed protein product [Trichogramma brassicae]
MERNTNEEQRRSFAAVVRGATGRTAPSVRPAMDERAGASSSERNASEEARASQEAVAELNEYVRLMELGVPARLRPEPEGRAVVEVSGELIPVFARPSMHASEDAMDWEESVQPGNYSWQRPRGNNERTPTEEELPVSVDRPAALARASVLHRRARDVARTEEESRCWRRRHGQCWSSWWRPVNRWKNGTARHSRRFFVARLKRKFCCWRRGRRRLRFVAQVRRRRKAHGCRPHLWHPFKNHLRCRCLHQFSREPTDEQARRSQQPSPGQQPANQSQERSLRHGEDNLRDACTRWWLLLLLLLNSARMREIKLSFVEVLARSSTVSCVRPFARHVKVYRVVRGGSRHYYGASGEQLDEPAGIAPPSPQSQNRRHGSRFVSHFHITKFNNNPHTMPEFLGKRYKLSTSENFDELMKALGVGLIVRKMGAAVSPVVEVTENNGEYTMKTQSTFKNQEIKFKLGEEFDEETPDGRKVKSVITLDGNKMTHVQKGDKETLIEREFTPTEMKAKGRTVHADAEDSYGKVFDQDPLLAIMIPKLLAQFHAENDNQIIKDSWTHSRVLTKKCKRDLVYRMILYRQNEDLAKKMLLKFEECKKSMPYDDVINCYDQWSQVFEHPQFSATLTERKCRHEQKKTLAHTKPSEARRTLREMSSKIAQARRLIILRTPRVSSSVLYTYKRPEKHSGSGDSLPLPLPRLHTCMCAAADTYTPTRSNVEPRHSMCSSEQFLRDREFLLRAAETYNTHVCLYAIVCSCCCCFGEAHEARASRYSQPRVSSRSSSSGAAPLLRPPERDVQLARTTTALQRPQIARLYRFYYYILGGLDQSWSRDRRGPPPKWVSLLELTHHTMRIPRNTPSNDLVKSSFFLSSSRRNSSRFSLSSLLQYNSKKITQGRIVATGTDRRVAQRTQTKKARPKKNT